MKESKTFKKAFYDETDELNKALSCTQQVIDEHKAEVKALVANIKLLDKTVRKSHEVSVALHKDLELSLSDVECSIERDIWGYQLLTGSPLYSYFVF